MNIQDLISVMKKWRKVHPLKPGEYSLAVQLTEHGDLSLTGEFAAIPFYTIEELQSILDGIS
jgi:hypothetical protein